MGNEQETVGVEMPPMTIFRAWFIVVLKEKSLNPRFTIFSVICYMCYSYLFILYAPLHIVIYKVIRSTIIVLELLLLCSLCCKS